MPFLDRFWWLRSLAALVLLAGTAAPAVDVAANPQGFGLNLGDGVARAALIAAVLRLLMSSAFGIQDAARRARRRERKQLYALPAESVAPLTARARVGRMRAACASLGG